MHIAPTFCRSNRRLSNSQCTRGQGMTEFIILILVIVVGLIAAVAIFGKAIKCRLYEMAQWVDVDSSEPLDCEDEGAPSPPSPPAPPPSTLGTSSTTTTTIEEFHRFDRPMQNGYRLDHCLHFGADCDRPAADYFCRQMGYAYSTEYGVNWAGIADTWVPIPGIACHTPPANPGCGPFDYITCRR